MIAVLGSRAVRPAASTWWRERLAVDLDRIHLVGSLAAAGRTVMVVTRDDEPVGLLAVADPVRASSRRVVEALHRLGVDRVMMLTGDQRRIAEAIAGATRVDEVRAQMLPQDKSAAVAELAAETGPVAMVGDGINDAPALAVADVGIAIGASGTTVALESADVALMADELDKLPDAVRLARRAMRVVHQNVALSLAAVVALVTAALAGQLTLTEGLLLNEGAARWLSSPTVYGYCATGSLNASPDDRGRRSAPGTWRRQACGPRSRRLRAELQRRRGRSPHRTGAALDPGGAP
jgi:cation transport ATPase